MVEHCPRIVLTASDEFQPLAHLLTREIGSLLFVPWWCTLLAEQPPLHGNRSKKNGAIKVKLRSRDHSSTNSKHACTEGSVTNLKMCYGESADSFWLSLVYHGTGLHLTFDVTCKQTLTLICKNFIFHKYESYMKHTNMPNRKRLCMGLYATNKVQNCSTTNCQHSMVTHAPKLLSSIYFLGTTSKNKTLQPLQHTATISEKLSIFSPVIPNTTN
jgi:hypothetical protein